MRRGTVILVAALVLAFIAGTGMAVYLGHRTFTTTGARAVAAMNAEESAALARLSSIDRTMGVEEVHRVLGPPTEDLFILAKWNGFGGSPLSQARVYFVGGHAAKIRWMKLGYFVYEKNL